MKRKLIALLMIIVTMLSLALPAFADSGASTSMEDILVEYHSDAMKLSESAPSAYRTGKASTSLDELTANTVSKLRRIGYDAYTLSSKTYEALEKSLDTDFSEIGLKKDCTYIVVLGDEPMGGAQAQSTTGSAFTYTYNSKQYKLRRVTITSADDSSYGKSSYKDLLTSHTKAFIENMLNSVISIVLDAISKKLPLGTIASIFGLKLANFENCNNATMLFQANTAWTRIYTQAYDDNMGQWVYGSMVEYVKQTCYIRGDRYNSTINNYEEYSSDKKTNTTYTEHYNSTTWKNEQAIISLIGSLPVIGERTGSVVYKRGDSTIITHSENF